MSQQNISAAILSVSKYKPDSKEQQTKEEAVAKWIGYTVITVKDEDFILMMEAIDKKLTVPNKTKISNLINKLYETEIEKFKRTLASAGRYQLELICRQKKKD